MQKNAPSICRLHLNLSCKAHLAPRTEKNTKKRARLPRQTVCHLPTRQKKNLSAPRQQASYSTRRSSPSPHDNKQSKEKAEAMPPFKLFSRHSATIGKKQKRIPSPPQLKKRAATGHPAARQQIEKTPQPDTLRPIAPLPSNLAFAVRSVFFAPPYFKSFAPLSNPLNAAIRSALKKRSTKN